MKIQSVSHNNRKRAFEIVTRRGVLAFPYAKLQPAPEASDTVARVYVDEEFGREAFTYELKSGEEGSLHMDSVLEYNEDPQYMRELLLYKLTVEAVKHLEASRLSKREIIRQLGTSPAQFYRLVDPTNTRKSVDKMLSLLRVLDCEVDFNVRPLARVKDFEVGQTGQSELARMDDAPGTHGLRVANGSIRR